VNGIQTHVSKQVVEGTQMATKVNNPDCQGVSGGLGPSPICTKSLPNYALIMKPINYFYN